MTATRATLDEWGGATLDEHGATLDEHGATLDERGA
jgi:hypothetical protein